MLPQVTKPDTGAFEQHLASDVSVFRNLGGDAVLVSPRQVSGIDALTYVHLANYVRGAPPQQVLLLWAEVGSAVEKRVSEMKGKPVWLSTSGLGVYWLHVRLDSTPKYYTYDPYKRCRAAGPN